MLLQNRKEKIQIKKKSSFQSDVTADVLQDSIDSSLLSDLYSNDLAFLVNITLSNYAGNNNLFIFGEEE